MSVDQIRDDDQGYLAWTAAHPGGYVINVERSLNPCGGRLHRADSHTINGRPARGRTWTGPYIKICSVSARELHDWARANLSRAILRCGACEPPADRSAASQPGELKLRTWYRMLVWKFMYCETGRHLVQTGRRAC